jgi:hypothetical protein
VLSGRENRHLGRDPCNGQGVLSALNDYPHIVDGDYVLWWEIELAEFSIPRYAESADAALARRKVYK